MVAPLFYKRPQSFNARVVFPNPKKKGGEKMKPVQSCLSLLLLAGVMGYNPIAIFFLARVRSPFYLQQVLGCAPCGNRNDCPVRRRGNRSPRHL